jgi:hypothetical protein
MENNPHKFINWQLIRKTPPSLYRNVLGVVAQNRSLNTNILPKHIRREVKYERMRQEIRKK